MKRWLKNMQIDEVSLVDQPATNTPFFIIKSDDKPKWDSVQRILRGYSDSDLELLDDQAVETMPIQKASSGNPFPSITHQINLNKQGIEDYLNELDTAEIEEENE